MAHTNANRIDAIEEDNRRRDEIFAEFNARLHRQEAQNAETRAFQAHFGPQVQQNNMLLTDIHGMCTWNFNMRVKPHY
jgi:hypothetical protein